MRGRGHHGVEEPGRRDAGRETTSGVSRGWWVWLSPVSPESGTVAEHIHPVACVCLFVQL